MNDISEVLEERGKRYGNYRKQAGITMDLRHIVNSGLSGKVLDPDLEDALTMICVKIARIVNGDPEYADNWHDIAGYATLVADRLDGNERE